MTDTERKLIADMIRTSLTNLSIWLKAAREAGVDAVVHVRDEEGNYKTTLCEHDTIETPCITYRPPSERL